jgi:hypothetical protein
VLFIELGLVLDPGVVQALANTAIDNDTTTRRIRTPLPSSSQAFIVRCST